MNMQARSARISAPYFNGQFTGMRLDCLIFLVRNHTGKKIGHGCEPRLSQGEPMSDRAPVLLIVDDIEANRAILARRFQHRGFLTVEADCGARALELLDQQSFDVVLLDVMMPDLDGLEVLRRIRQRFSAAVLPVIMVTAKSEGVDIAEALEAGASDYITKPVDFVVALARTKTQLALKRAEEASSRAQEALHNANEQLEERVLERTAELEKANTQLKTEILQREQSEAELVYMAHHDPLTGLGNRRSLKQHLERMLRRVQRTGEAVAVLMVDLDGFKSVNDALGHSVGDSLLRAVAGHLREHLREGDEVARLGGDEFAIIQLGGEQPKDAANLAGRLIEKIGEPWSVEGHQLIVGASIGIALASDTRRDPEDLLRSADLAMYRAKADGRATVRFFETEMDAHVQARRKLEMELRTAVRANALELHYQPLVDLRDNRVTGVEALLRWHHPELGSVSPMSFIPIAEEIGLIVPLGAWVLRQACADAMKWPHEITVSVNLSPVQFKHSGLVTDVLDALAQSGLPANRLELEITESVLLAKTESNLAVLNELRSHGVRISLDDFGTGYSSLSYLCAFQFDKIKIDQSFVRNVATDENSRSIVRVVADLGSSFGIRTNAEGIETEEQVNWLKSEGYIEGQGYLFGRPSRAGEIPGIVAAIAQRQSPSPSDDAREPAVVESISLAPA
jgi:diguanylate cyclase (GGDEF)-like protein